MKQPFRLYHLIQLLEAYDRAKMPLDQFLSQYFRKEKAVGSKDRKEIAETTYALMRWKDLLDAFVEGPVTWEKRYGVWTRKLMDDQAKVSLLPLHTQVSFPEPLYNLFVDTYGQEKAFQLCLDSNQPAPITIRINALKATRDEWVEKWAEPGSFKLCDKSPYGVRFINRENFFCREDFRQGFFEVQDEASQLVASLVEAKPGQQVIDYCAGSGGKTLAYAPAMQGKGQIYLHDIRPHVLLEAKKRLKRAGIENAQISNPDCDKLKRLKKRMDWVLVDAPCSGTGTLRRNPDMKWRIDKDAIERLIGQQRIIFEKALSFLKDDGVIVYATCSILSEENERQLEHFLKTYGLKLRQDPFKSLPERGGMDGFFAAQLTR
ncbi:MAG: rsmB [Chlamydiales bacterium]|jgi:16S rRNA (cytosine(967)-C(5))-methyltransferase|nr:rsmB [Chlamydiales bacterium]